MDPCVAFITATQGQHIHECRWTLTMKTLWLLQDGALKQNGQRLLQPSNLSGSPSRRLSVRLCLGATHVVQFGKSAGVESLALVNWQAVLQTGALLVLVLHILFLGNKPCSACSLA